MANSPSTAPTPKQQPAHELRLGTIKAAIWRNDTESGVRFNVTFERLYMQENEWRSTSSFGRDDLLTLAKVADLAHSWIMNPEAEAKPTAARAKHEPSTNLTDKSLPKRPAAER